MPHAMFILGTGSISCKILHASLGQFPEEGLVLKAGEKLRTWGGGVGGALMCQRPKKYSIWKNHFDELDYQPQITVF